MRSFESLRNFVLGLLCFGLLTFSLSACPKKQVVKKTVEEEPKNEDEVTSNELDIHGKEFVSIPTLSAIHFEYDSSELTEASRTVLANNAAFLKKHPEMEILSEGHTDERGTIGYNLSLGQKRAQSVRQYYISLGLPEKALGSLSFGKEKPACVEVSETCWTENRRVETKVRSLADEKVRTTKEDSK